MNFKVSILSAIVAAPLLMASPSHAAAPVDLGAAGDYAILAETTITNTGVSTSVVGNVGMSPNPGSSIVGFALTLPAASPFSTSALVTGKLFAADYAPPTPANLTTAVGDMEAAYTDAAGRAAGVTELGAGTLTGLTLVGGVYSWSTAVSIPTTLTLSGGPSDVWIFQIAGTLNTAAASRIILSGGAQARHVFWQVADVTTLGANSQFKGIILDQTAITMGAGAAVDGRLLAQSAVTMISNTVNSGGVAQIDSPLVDGFFFIAGGDPNDPNDNTCGVGVNGGVFAAYGDVSGVGTGTQVVKISYNTPQPTSTNRSGTKISVKQNKFSTLNILLDGVSATGGPVSVEKCSVTGSVNSSKLTGSVSTSCKTDTLFALLTPAQIASVQQAFTGNKNVKIKVNTNASKGSLSIKCKGAALHD